MVLAGPVFPEWYWTPIFLIVLTAPVTGLIFAAVAIWLRKRAGWTVARSIAAGLACAAVLPAILLLAYVP